MTRLAGKTAIITGAAAGFGEGMAKRFAEEGANVVVADLNHKGAETVAAAIGKKAIAVEVDVSRKHDIDAMVAAAMDAFGRVDIMINNAGFTHRNGSMLEVDESTFDLITAVNMKAIYYASLAVVPIMEMQGGGSIITTASTAGGIFSARGGATFDDGSRGTYWVKTPDVLTPFGAGTSAALNYLKVL